MYNRFENYIILKIYHIIYTQYMIDKNDINNK